MPLPRRFETASELNVASSAPTRAIRHAGVIASVRPAAWSIVRLGGLRTHAAIETWASLARILEFHDLVAVAEFIVTPPSPWKRPIAAREQLTEWVARAAGMKGAKFLRTVDARVRVGARSRPETLLRLMLEDCGLPLARINEEIHLSSGRVAAPDLSWPEYRVAAEYDGDYHRDRRQFARDLLRTDELVDDGWSVVHVVGAQLYGRPSAIVARVVGRLASRGAPTRLVTRFPSYEP
jgi:very-short-patch-repair endonuclease